MGWPNRFAAATVIGVVVSLAGGASGLSVSGLIPAQAGNAWSPWTPNWNYVLGFRDTYDYSSGNPGEYGVDVDIGAGTPIYAPQPGTITWQPGTNCGGWFPGRILLNVDSSSAIIGFGHINPSVTSGHVVGGQLLGVEDAQPLGCFAPHVEFMYDSTGASTGSKTSFVPPSASPSNGCPQANWNGPGTSADPCVVLAGYMHGTAPLPNGSFIQTPDGVIYRVAGGAALRLSNCSVLGGCSPLVQVSNLAQFSQVPANGTWLLAATTGPNTGQVYHVAGGAPMQINDCNPFGGNGCSGLESQWIAINQSTINTLGLDPTGTYHLSSTPVNGTWLLAASTSPNAGQIYHVAGGAPMQITDCNPFGGNGCAGLASQWVAVNPWTISSLGLDAGGSHHLTAVPIDGTWLLAATTNPNTGQIYHVAGGAPLQITNCTPWGSNGCAGLSTQWVAVNQATITSLAVDAGGSHHLNLVPTNGTWLLATDSSPNSGLVYRVAGGAALNINDCGPFGGNGCLGLQSQWIVVNVATINSLGADAAGTKHLYAVPATGTILEGLPSQTYWEMFSGSLSLVLPPQPTAVGVDDSDIDQFPIACRQTPCPSSASHVNSVAARP